MIWVFEISVIVLIYLEYRLYKKIITPFSVMAFPYTILILINNSWATGIGFYEISDSVMLMVLIGLTLVFLGSLITWNGRRILSKKEVSLREDDCDEFELYNFRGMRGYAIFVEVFSFLKMINVFINGGFSFFVADANEGYMLRGITGHLLLSLYPVVPILIYYWLKNKNKISYLIVSLTAIFFLFLSFVKYHVIALLVLVYLFVTFKDRKYIKVGTAIIVVVPIAIFLGNYYITFFIRGTLDVVGNQFYRFHLWKYMAGSLIHDSVIFGAGVNIHWSVLYKIGRLICALPNMFLYPFFGYKPLFTGIESDLGMSAVGNMGEAGNTVDFIGYLFPSQGGILNYIMFGIALIVFGYLSSKLYNKAYDDLKNYSTLTTALTFMVFFCFFSFFGVYGGLSTPWEILVWSMVIPNLFYANARVKFKLGGSR